MKENFFTRALVVGVPLVIASLGHAATITVVPAGGNRGTSVDIPLNFGAATLAVSAMQFDLSIPAGISVVSFTPGSASSGASKVALSSTTTGKVRVVVAPLNNMTPTAVVNQNAIATGTLATLRLAINGTAAGGALPINISNIVAVAPNATVTATTGSNGSITVPARCDLTNDGVQNIQDLQAAVNAVLAGVQNSAFDLNRDFIVNIGDVQAIVNVMLTPGSCPP